MGFTGSALPLEHIKPQTMENLFPLSVSESTESNLSITVVGASGDLAKKKIFPALFALYYEDCLPEVWLLSLAVTIKYFAAQNLQFQVLNVLQNFIIFGYARTKMTDEELRNTISKTLTCIIDKRYLFL